MGSIDDSYYRETVTAVLMDFHRERCRRAFDGFRRLAISLDGGLKALFVDSSAALWQEEIGVDVLRRLRISPSDV